MTNEEQLRQDRLVYGVSFQEERTGLRVDPTEFTFLWAQRMWMRKGATGLVAFRGVVAGAKPEELPGYGQSLGGTFT
jgi:hypothetical protein